MSGLLWAPTGVSRVAGCLPVAGARSPGLREQRRATSQGRVTVGAETRTAIPEVLCDGDSSSGDVSGCVSPAALPCTSQAHTRSPATHDCDAGGWEVVTVLVFQSSKGCEGARG